MLNRTLSPVYRQVSTINFIHPDSNKLNNGIPVFAFNEDDKELVRIEFIFNNVNWDARKPLQSIAVNSLFNSGTPVLTAHEIAEQIDYYGAFLQSDYGADQIVITLYSLRKYLEAIFPVVRDMLTAAIFPLKELDIYIQNQKQKLQVNLQKNDFMARKAFAHTIFGDTPYGSDILPEHYDQLTRESLLDYYKAAFNPHNCTIIAAGSFGKAAFELLNRFFGDDWGQALPARLNHFEFKAGAGRKLHLEKAGSIQNAIRIGKLAITRTHPDFPALQVLNTVLGGYFGSRLMANIREDKGYTYGIGSGVVSLKHAGYFFISTEVGADVCTAALKEIYRETDLLKTEKISADELGLVRNYMLGSLLGSLENIFSHADKFKNLLFSGLDYTYYERYIETVKTVDADTLLQIANRYLTTDAFNEVVAGKV